MDFEKLSNSATIKALQNQRNAYANESVNLAVQVVLLQERNKELEAKLAETKPEPEKMVKPVKRVKNKPEAPKTDTDTPQ